MLINRKIKGPETDIRIEGYAPSTYYLRVICSEGPGSSYNVIKTFIIIKN